MSLLRWYRRRFPGRSLLAALCIAAVATTPAAAARCDSDQGDHLKALQAVFLNAFYFSDFNSPTRCTNLQSAIYYRQQLTSWLQLCEPKTGTRLRHRLLSLGDVSFDAASGCGS
jgi:hypothetical protein